jgi:dTDP-4-amino-4,6-dideoxygalactose transaminase
MQAMLERGVATRRGIMCAHREPAYAATHGQRSLTHSERATERCILLPMFAQMTLEEQDRVIAALRDAVGL